MQHLQVQCAGPEAAICLKYGYVYDLPSSDSSASSICILFLIVYFAKDKSGKPTHEHIKSLLVTTGSMGTCSAPANGCCAS